MTIIFDLDYTLLDTNLFRKELAMAMGISTDNYNVSYADRFYNDNGTETPYHPEIHLDYLIKKGIVLQTAKEIIMKDVLKVVKNLNKCLFWQAEKVFDKCKEKKYNLILITWGNKDWQKLKIDNLRIKKYFDKIITADKDKDECIDFLINSDDEKIIINDNLKESLKLQKKLKNSKIFLIKSKYSRNDKNLLPEHSLEDCLAIL